MQFLLFCEVDEIGCFGHLFGAEDVLEVYDPNSFESLSMVLDRKFR